MGPSILHASLMPVLWFVFVIGSVCLGADLDPSIVVDKEHVIDPEVENGTAYDKAVVDLRAARRVVLPDTAVLRRGGGVGTVRLLMAKRLSFGGHPPEPMTLSGARKNMGCAVRAEGGSLVVATYGEWDSRVEGGADITLIAIVPDGLEVKRRKGLSGPRSEAQEHRHESLAKPTPAKGRYWYGPTSPAEGWNAVAAEPDASWAEANWPDSKTSE